MFVGQNSTPFDRVDFTAFAHRRILRDARESDKAEVGIFSYRTIPDVAGKTDLARREQTPIDLDPMRGGVINVLAENVEAFGRSIPRSSHRHLDRNRGIRGRRTRSTLGFPSSSVSRSP